MSEPFRLADSFSDDITQLVGDFGFVNGRKYSVLDVACSFDIEASSFEVEDRDGNAVKQGCMYAWVFGMNGKCIRGRTWDEFKEVLAFLSSLYGLSPKKRLMVYVHNLSYEFQWIRKRFDWYEVFSVEERKPCYAVTTDGIMFRCSYLLSGMSLDLVGKNLTKYKVLKRKGDLDYDLLRFPTTPLTDTEWGYILNDGLVVMAYIQEEKERTGGLLSLPNTKTGYVRDLCRSECLNGDGRNAYVRLMRTLTLTADDYAMLKRAFTGGFTHGNHKRVGKVWENVSSYDFTSSYPAVMLSEKFPMSAPKQVTVTDRKQFDRLVNSYACVFNVKFVNIRATADYEHYISASRCLKLEHYLLDNGRVVNASLLIITLTEQDWFIIRQMYKWDRMMIGTFRVMTKDYLPKPFLDCVLDLYEKKTTLKGVAGKEQEYLISKGMLNSCYGMCVTDICRPKATYEEGEWHTEKPDAEEEMRRYDRARGRFLFYAWGVWITAYARRNLFTAINMIKDDYLYADTDSVKIVNREKHMDYFDEYNSMITKKIAMCLTARGLEVSRASPKTIKGVTKPLGVWDYEGTWSRFKTLGAKRYMVEYGNGDMAITIAGVAKKAGADYLRAKYRTNDSIFRHFTEGLVFPPTYEAEDGSIRNGAGKLLHTYIDDEIRGRAVDYMGNEGAYHELSAVHLEPTGYDMSMEATFFQYVFGMKMDYLTGE